MKKIIAVRHKRENEGRRGGTEETHALEVHCLHGFVHAFYDARHVPRHVSQRHGRLDSARDRVDSACEAEEV